MDQSVQQDFKICRKKFGTECISYEYDNLNYIIT
jgi:hypothetical protein